MKKFCISGWIIACFYLYNLLTLNNIAYSQLANTTFERITTEDGLSQSSVNYIIQDQKGFMWFATYGGINKYDGYTFKTYTHIENDSSSLSDNGIIYLYEDKKGYIWAVNNANQGICKFDPVTEKFITYKHNPNDSTTISSNTVYYVTEDKLGNIWISTDNALNLVFENNHITKFKRFDISPIEGRFARIYEDRHGKLLLFANYLYYFDRQSNTICKTNTLLNQSNAVYDIISICEDKTGNIWLGTSVYGIIKLVYNKESKSYERSTFNKKEIPPDNGNYLIIDKNDKIWIASGTKGLFQYNENEDLIINFLNNKCDFNSISDNGISSLYIDHSDILWIGTESQGLCKYNLSKKEFFHYKCIYGDKNTLSGNVISSIHSTTPGELWVGVESSGGVNRFIFKNKGKIEVIHYKYNPKNKNTIAGDKIFCLLQRKNGEVWAGSADCYISKIIPEKPGTNELPIIKRFVHKNWTFSIYEDNERTLWGGTWRGGLWRYNEKIDTFIYYQNDPENPSSLCDDIIWAISGDDSGNIWIGGHGGGLSILPSEDKNKLNPKFINYKNESNNNRSLSNNTIHVFYLDKTGTMWIGTTSGLDRVIRKNNNFSNIKKDNKLEFYSYHIKDGLPSEAIIGIEEDDSGNLWLSTSNGISKFNVKENTFINYDESNGLQSNEFWHNAYFKDQNERIYFGGQNGFNAFYPDSLKLNPFLPKVVFTDLKILYKSVEVGEKVNGDVVLTKSLNETSKIVLSRKNKVFTLEFAALHYVQPKKNKYTYKLEGFDKNWIKTNADRNFVSYTDLPEGKYTFKVKASNSDGIWNEKETSLKIIILTPWWKTLVFKILSILLLIASAISIYYYRINRLEKQKIYLEEKVNDRTKEIEEKNKVLTEQACVLNETNTILEERQQIIEEQAEELKSQKEELENTNIYLDKTNKLLQVRQKQIEKQAEELNAKNKNLKMLNATKDRFLSIIAHDLKNPFSSISGFSEILQSKINKLTDQKKQQYAKAIYDSTQIITNLLENLLQWARSQTENIQTSPEEIDLNEVFDTNINLMKDLLKEKEITVTRNTPDVIKIIADRNMINTVMRNLITNAIKFTEKGEIKIEVKSTTKGFWKCSIIDTGSGIPKNKLNSLFDIGTSKSVTGTRGETGTGLGLILCKDFIEKNGGEIWIESKEGKGSKFIFTIPFTQ